MKVYFAGAIRGGREKVYDYAKYVECFENNGCEVLTKHVADPNLTAGGENLSPEEIYNRDCEWLKESDIVFADITVPSLGVGYEICEAKNLGKKVYAVYDKKENVSGFLRGDTYITFLAYNDCDEVLDFIENITQHHIKSLRKS